MQLPAIAVACVVLAIAVAVVFLVVIPEGDLLLPCLFCCHHLFSYNKKARHLDRAAHSLTVRSAAEPPFCLVRSAVSPSKTETASSLV
jgi:hypothetical protein